MTKDDEEKFRKADECHICNKKYNKTDERVRDHVNLFSPAASRLD